MSPDRATAYRRVMRTLAELGPVKLNEAEQQRIRLAADNLIFSRALEEDVEAQEAIDDVERLCHALVDSGRWEQSLAAQLAEDLIECGPMRLELFQAA